MHSVGKGIHTKIYIRACFRSYGINNNGYTICNYNVFYSSSGKLFYQDLSKKRSPSGHGGGGGGSEMVGDVGLGR